MGAREIGPIESGGNEIETDDDKSKVEVEPLEEPLGESLELEVDELAELAAASSVLDEIPDIVLDELLDEVLDEVVVFGAGTKTGSIELAPSLEIGEVIESRSTLEDDIRLLNKASKEDPRSLLVRDDVDESNDVVESSKDDEGEDDEEDEEGSTVNSADVDGITGC